MFVLPRLKVSLTCKLSIGYLALFFTNNNFLPDIAVAELAEVSENEDYLKDSQEKGKRGGKAKSDLNHQQEQTVDFFMK